MNAQENGPLAGLRVIELANGIAGAFCAKLLADYGADVLTIEPPGGSPIRADGPFVAGTPALETGAHHLYLNTNKRSVVLDLANAKARERLLSLIDGADAVIESFAPGALAAFGLRWESLRQRRPGLVLCSLTPFGQDGPYAGYTATNLTMYAMSGQMRRTGDPEREPLKQGGSQAEYQLGLNGFAATAIALFGAAVSGLGEHLDVAAMQCMASILEEAVPLWAYLSRDTGGRRGNIRSSSIGIYPCADGYLGIHSMARNWRPLAETMELPDLVTDPRFSTPRARMEHNDELIATFYAWAADKQQKEVYARAGSMRGPIAYVHTLADLLESPQLTARGYFQQIDHPVAGRRTYPGAPFSMSASPWRAGRAPLLGEHTDAVLAGSAAPASPELHLAPAPTAPLDTESSRRRHRLPLEGVRVLDLTMVWAGPYATRLLGDMGAEVIKVESARFWDMLRSLTFLPPETERLWDKSAYFNHNNRDKYSLSLDLSDARGRDLLLRLVAECDVVIENYRADVLSRLGLDYETLRAAKPDVILVSMPGHGKSGPEQGYIAYGTNVEQLAGLVSLTGYTDGPPQASGISYGDPIAGITAAGAVALALRHRLRTGEGQYVELAQREALTTLIGEQIVGYSITGELPSRAGNRHPRHAPHGAYRCAGEDAWLTLACTTDAEFRALCSLIGRPELTDDPRYATEAARHTNQEDLDEPITAWTSGRDHYAAMAALQAAGTPAGAVLTAPELFQDPHLRARGFWEPIAHPEAGDWEVDGVAWRLVEHPAHVRLPAPSFAEHNQYVLRHLLGLDEAEVAALEAADLIGSVPDMAVHR